MTLKFYKPERRHPEKADEDNKSIELALSILLSVSFAQGLTILFSNITDDAPWMLLTLIYTSIIIWIIYFVMKIPAIQRYSELLRASTIGLFTLFPYVLQRFFQQKMYYLLSYLLVLGILMFIWAHREQKNSAAKDMRNLSIFFIVVILVAIGLTAMRTGWGK